MDIWDLLGNLVWQFKWILLTLVLVIAGSRLLKKFFKALRGSRRG